MLLRCQVFVGRWQWQPLQCNFSGVVLRSAAGGGANLSVTVYVGDQFNDVTTPVSYSSPLIASVTVPDGQLATVGAYTGSLVTL